MPILIDKAVVNTVSSEVDAVGPILVAVVGTLSSGMVRITANLGSGEADAMTYYAGDRDAVARLEFAPGVTFKAYLVGVVTDDVEVTVEYINV